MSVVWTWWIGQMVSVSGLRMEKKTLTMTTNKYGTKSLFSNRSVNIWGKWTFTSTCSLTKGSDARHFSSKTFYNGSDSRGCSSFFNTWESPSLLVGAPWKSHHTTSDFHCRIIVSRHIHGINVGVAKSLSIHIQDRKKQSL